MAGIDLAERVHNHNYGFDPYVRSLLDTDFYKLLMGQVIFSAYGQRQPIVTFTVKNRSRRFRLADLVSEEDLRRQLDHVASLRFSKNELIWLRGNTFYGQDNIFDPRYISALSDLRLPAYDLSRDESGEFVLSFTGPWLAVSQWEIPALAILNEAKSRKAMSVMSRYQLRLLYANATSRLHEKLKRLRNAGVPRISEFGTRRRHGFLWQEQVIEAMREELGQAFSGTSNALQAMRNDIEAVGTNAHELPMVMAALSRIRRPHDQGALDDSQFEVLRHWQRQYGQRLLVALPDTYGTSQFLRKAPLHVSDIRNWSGFRIDSKDPFVAGNEILSFWRGIGEDPRDKLTLFSDGLDVDQMVGLHQAFGTRTRDAYGWGTMATNDFRGCDPREGDGLDPVSLVCKVTRVSSADGSAGAVKLSDNYLKATGPEDEVSWYRTVFGTEGVSEIPITV